MLALASVLSYFSGFGTQVLLLRDVSRHAERFQESFGVTILSLFISTPVIYIIYILFSLLLLPTSIRLTEILLLGIAEILFWPLCNIGIIAFQAHERMGRASRMILAPVLFRLFAAIIFLLSHSMLSYFRPILVWSIYYTLSMAFASFYIQFYVNKDLGKPIIPKQLTIHRKIREGLVFSFWNMADRLYADADKILVAKLSSLDSAGLYSAGYRLVDLLFLPIHALMSSASPRLFRSGASGANGTFRYLLNIFPAVLLYSFAATVLLLVTSPAVPFILGHSYHGAIEVIQWLAWFPLVGSIPLVLKYSLAASGHQRFGMAATLASGTVNIILNILLIPFWDWRGAVASTYAAEIILGLCMALYLVYSAKTDRRIYKDEAQVLSKASD